MSDHQRRSDPLSNLLRSGGRTLSNQLLRMGTRNLGRLATRGIALGLRGVIVKTAPLWGPLLIILLLAYLAFMLIFSIPKTIAEDASATEGDRVAGFFGFSDDQEGWDDIFEIYQEVANRWSEGLTAEQINQAKHYALNWSVLAATDRLRNDPFIKMPGMGPVMIVDGESISVDGVYPPSAFIPIYQSAAKKYGVDWQVLASIHYVESTYSTYPAGTESSYGAKGPVQFMPCTWVGWNHPSCTGKGKGNFTDSELSDVSLIKKYKGYGIDGDGDGKADIWNEIDAIHGAANYLASHNYKKDIYKAIYNYNHADWYVQRVLQTAEMIHQMHEIREEHGEVDEYNLDELNIKKFTFFDLSEQDNMITPRPEETFAALRPIFHWEDREEIWEWEELICRQTEDGEVCTWEKKKRKRTVSLLMQADTYQGTYTHHYQVEKIEQSASALPFKSGNPVRKVFVTKDNLVRVETPSEEEYMQPFYDYLYQNGIYQELDVELVFELMEMYDLHYVKLKENLDSLFYENYPTIEGTNNWIWPTPSTRITSRFGPRKSPCAGCSSFHKGVDIGGTTPGVEGDPVWSIDNGIVESAYFSASGGNMITIDHGNGIKSRYLHLQSMHVRAGQTVSRGTLIGTMGKTGYGNGVHLHFDIIINGSYYDPLAYFSIE